MYLSYRESIQSGQLDLPPLPIDMLSFIKTQKREG